MVVTIGGGGKFTTMLKGCVVDCGGLLLSVTIRLKVLVPAGPVGAPAIVPLVKLKPAGSVEPVATAKVNGP